MDLKKASMKEIREELKQRLRYEQKGWPRGTMELLGPKEVKKRGRTVSWKTRSHQISFMMGRAGSYGVQCEIALEDAQNLVKNLNKCIQFAKKINEKTKETTDAGKTIDLRAHWGKEGPEGYRLDVRVHKHELLSPDDSA